MLQQTRISNSWSTTLSTILRPFQTQSCFNPTVLRHPPGEIWRHLLTVCIYSDLAGIRLDGQIGIDIHRRRFVRIEHIGLSGVAFYQFPVGQGHNEKHRTESGGAMTVKTIFGDPDDPHATGMNLDTLLDGIGAKIVYFPAYACTSFVIGQLMQAYMFDRPKLRPFPAHEGFSVNVEACLDMFENNNIANMSENTIQKCTQEHSESEKKLEVSRPSQPDNDGAVVATSYSDHQLDLVERYKGSSSPCSPTIDSHVPLLSGDQMSSSSDYELQHSDIEDDMQDVDPHAALRIRTSILSMIKSLSDHSLFDEECDGEGDTSVSTIESVEPRTPPRALSPVPIFKRGENSTENVVTQILEDRIQVDPINLVSFLDLGEDDDEVLVHSRDEIRRPEDDNFLKSKCWTNKENCKPGSFV